MKLSALRNVKCTRFLELFECDLWKQLSVKPEPIS